MGDSVHVTEGYTIDVGWFGLDPRSDWLIGWRVSIGNDVVGVFILIKCHKTIYNKWLGSVRAMGPKPVSYCGNIPVDETTFQFTWNEDAKELLDFFIPINDELID